MTKQKRTLLAAVAIVCAIAVCGYYLLTHKNMTGVPYSEIEAYRATHPNVTVSYTVTVDGGTQPLKIKSTDTSVALNDLNQIESLTAQAEYLQDVKFIFLGSLEPSALQAAALIDAFPNAAVQYDSIHLLGRSYAANVTELDLSALSPEDTAQAAAGLKALKQVAAVTLTDADGNSTLPLENAVELCRIRPDITYQYRFELFGKELSTDMERVEYLKAEIGDEGLDTIRSVIPLMHKLNYLKLDWCGTSDEATAALREELAEQGIKVVWRVFFGGKYGGQPYSALTDTLKIWANYTPTGANCEPLKYCNEVRYMDLGHSYVDDCSFVRYMPDLEVCILADTRLTDISPLVECKKLTFLEIFMTHVTDLSPLLEMPQLEFLNISEMFKLEDITPICSAEALPNLVHINCIHTELPKDQVEQFKENHPDSKNMFHFYGHSTQYDWRYTNKGGRKVPQYALLRQQIGYNDNDYSRYPGGYVTEPITYESTGITPPDWYIIKHGLEDQYELSTKTK